MPRFTATCHLPLPVDAALDWHRRPGALPRLLPPWERVRILKESEPLPGHESILLLGRWPLTMAWHARFHGLLDGIGFADEQVRGPFRRWRHVHRFDDHDGGGGCQLTDAVDYDLPLSPVSNWLFAGYVQRRLQRMFQYRQQRTWQDLHLHGRYRKQQRQTILVTGSSGLVGEQLVAFLRGAGHHVRRLTRHGADVSHGIFEWHPQQGQLDPEALRGCDAVVHLAGAPIAKRWTAKQRALIRTSRVRGTALLVNEVMRQAPQARLISASAIGWYGNTGEQEVMEADPHGSGFLAEVCRDWEAALAPARDAGMRVHVLRLGMVLSARGGALKAMLPAFRTGFGGRVGSGQQWMSWIALDDVLNLIEKALCAPHFPDLVNAVAPQPVRQAEFARLLAGILHRPAVVPVPAAAVRVVLGSMGDNVLLSSQRVRSNELSHQDYCFPDLEECLRWELGRMQSPA